MPSLIPLIIPLMIVVPMDPRALIPAPTALAMASPIPSNAPTTGSMTLVVIHVPMPTSVPNAAETRLPTAVTIRPGSFWKNPTTESRSAGNVTVKQ